MAIPDLIWNQFCFEGTFIDIEPCGKGHINDTLALRFQKTDRTEHRYVLQRINQFVFKNPAQVMDNIEKITAHLRRRIIEAGGNPERETLNLIPVVGGGTYVIDDQGEYWRAYQFIEGATTYETAENSQQIYNTGWAFGNFQKMLSDFPADQLHETIRNFHNTPSRFDAFMEACENDVAKRASNLRNEIDFLTKRKSETSILVDKQSSGQIPLRVTHNDTKLNNLMIDDQSGKVICILDLDTVMPGLVLYDFGDAVRTAAALISEDDPDWMNAGISLDKFDSLVKGYLDAARDFLLPVEVDYLSFSAKLITLEQAMRFLTDYLNGDIYYKTHRLDHNLDRARTQIQMVKDIEEKFVRMEKIVRRYR